MNVIGPSERVNRFQAVSCHKKGGKKEKRRKRDSGVILHRISHDVIPANRRWIIGNGAERELRSLPSCVCLEPTSYSWTRAEGAKKAGQFYCGTTWVTLSKFMHLRKKEQRDVCVFQQQLWGEQALCPFPRSLSPSFYRPLAALGAMTHWPSKKHSSTHPEVVPAKSSSSSPHNSSLFWEAAEGTVCFFTPTLQNVSANFLICISITV